MSITQNDVEQTSPSKAVARPLKVLVQLIKKDLDDADDAAKQAAIPFYKAAGEKLIEAKAQLRHGEWGSWLKRNFNRSERSARLYMSYAEATAAPKRNGNALPFPSLNEFNRAPAFKITEDDGLRRARAAAEERLREKEIHRRFMLTIVEHGYKALAKQLHPDKGGNAEDMARINKARKTLLKMIGPSLQKIDQEQRP